MSFPNLSYEVEIKIRGCSSFSELLKGLRGRRSSSLSVQAQLLHVTSPVSSVNRIVQQSND